MTDYTCECGSVIFTTVPGEGVAAFNRVTCANCGRDHGSDIASTGWMWAAKRIAWLEKDRDEWKEAARLWREDAMKDYPTWAGGT